MISAISHNQKKKTAILTLYFILTDIVITGFCLADKKADLIKCDATSKSPFHIGTTDSSGVTFSPVWESIYESNELLSLKRLLPSSNFLTKSPSHDYDDPTLQDVSQDKATLKFPLLQPISGGGGTLDGTTNEEGKLLIKLLPWESSVGAVVFQVRFADVLNRLPLFDDTVGEVVIPLDRIVKMKKIKGWFKVLKKGTRDTIEIQPEESDKDKQNDDNILSHSTQTDSNDNENKVLNNDPMILLELEIMFPEEVVTDIDRETSIVVAKEMIRSASLSQDTRVGIIGTSISTFNTVRGVTGNVQYLQNQLGSILDMIEMVRNAFNFSVSKCLIC